MRIQNTKIFIGNHENTPSKKAVSKFVNKMKLIEEDIKGSAVDENL